MTPDRMPRLQNFSPFFTAFGISGMEEKISSGILKGRPFGGAAILVHGSLLAATTSLLVTERVNAVRIGDIVFLNVYCPSKALSNRPIISSLLDEIGCVLNMHQACEVVLGGDFNVDLREASPHSNIFVDFFKKFNLYLAYDTKKTTGAYTFFREALGHYTMIDFFYSFCLSEILNYGTRYAR